MNNKIFPFGKWLCAEEYAAYKPIDVFLAQKAKEKIELPDALKNVRMLAKKTFNVKDISGGYKIRITGDDYYKLYINGALVGQGPAQGYHFCYYWNEFDVSEHLKVGENEIVVDVYYSGLINRVYNSGDRRIGFVAELYSDDEIYLYSDTDWECSVMQNISNKHIIGYDTMFSEDHDASDRFNASHFVEGTSDHIFSDLPAKALQVYSMKPVSIERLSGGGYLYDFGKEITASLNISAVGKDGDRIRILCGEELDEGPEKVRFNLRCNCLYEEYWTLHDGENTYSQYDYKAFRYAAIIPENTADIADIEAIVRHYPFDDDYCDLQTESEALKAVWDICKNGVKCGAQEVFVDCPTREKGQYAGDLTVTSASHLVLTGDGSLLKKAIDNQMQSLHYCDGLLCVTPGSFWQEIADYSLQFPLLALKYYKYSGDKDYLKENLSVCEEIISYFKRYARADGLLEKVDGKWNLVDWPNNLRDNYDFPLTEPIGEGCHNVVNAFYIGCVMKTEEIRDILSVENPRESASLIEAFNNEFFDKAVGLYKDTKESTHCALHSNVIPAFYGINEDIYNKTIGDFIMSKGLCCGVYVAYFVLKALCRMERFEDAYSLIISDSEHSWMNMVREGATACFEAWGKDQKWNTSLCHPWASAPVSVLAEDILPNMPAVGKLIYKNK